MGLYKVKGLSSMGVKELSKQALRETLRRMAQNEEVFLKIENEELENMLKVARAHGDNEMIALCDEVLCHRHDIYYEEVKEASGVAFRKQLKARVRMSRKSNQGLGACQRHAMRLVIVSMILVAVILSLEIIASKWVVKMYTSSDGEQIILETNMVSDPIIAVGEAERKEKEQWELFNVNDIPTRLGYEILLPQYIPEGMKLKVITGKQSSCIDSVVYRYEDEKKHYINIEFCKYKDGETFKKYDQNETGTIFYLTNGETVYITENQGELWGLMVSTENSYYISCKGFNETTLLSLFESI